MHGTDYECTCKSCDSIIIPLIEIMIALHMFIFKDKSFSFFMFLAIFQGNYFLYFVIPHPWCYRIDTNSIMTVRLLQLDHNTIISEIIRMLLQLCTLLKAGNNNSKELSKCEWCLSTAVLLLLYHEIIVLHQVYWSITITQSGGHHSVLMSATILIVIV